MPTSPDQSPPTIAPEALKTEPSPAKKPLGRIAESFLKLIGRTKTYKPAEPHEVLSEIATSPIEPEDINTESSPPLASQELLASEPPHTIIGMEQFDKLEEEGGGGLFEGALGFARTEEDRQFYQSKIDAVKEARRALCKKYGIDIDVAEKFRTAKPLSRIVIDRFADQLPPVEPGMVRMYRGEGPHQGKTDEQTALEVGIPYSDDGGNWFAHELDVASSYPLGELETSRMVYVDIPANSMQKYCVDNLSKYFGKGAAHEFILPNRIVAQTKEFVRFLRADTTDNPWPKIPTPVTKP